MAVPLIGRSATLATLERLLSDPSVRLLTLTGPGGIGKTRLALALVERHRGPTCFVDLAPLDDPDLLLTAIANALDLPDASRPAIIAALDRTLLVLDNFEHLLSATSTVAALLDASPHVRILVTSRAQLHLPAERHVPVAPLAGADAEALFIACATSARAEFSPTIAVAAICGQLDGLPLAIELAAARTRILSAEQIAERLGDALRVLAGGDATRPPRQRTLRATLDWSYRLLDAPEQTLLQRLSVFAGGATIEAVEALHDDPNTEIMDLLTSLVDRSLVQVAEDAGGMRYRLLEPIRHYALAHLRSADLEPAVRDRHAAWCLDLAERAAPELLGSDQLAWLDALQRDYANLRAANAWYLDQSRATDAQRLAGALWKFCEVRGHAAEGERWLDAALDLESGEPNVRSVALHGAANLAFVRGDYERATARHEESLALRRQLGDRRAIGITLFHLASVMRNRGDVARSLELCRAALATFRALDEPRWCANTLNSLGMTLLDEGAFAAARDALEEALALYRRLGGARGIAVALGNLADLDRFEADYDRAEDRLRQSLDIFDRLSDPWGSAATLESLALTASARGCPERGAVLFGAADAQRTEAGALLPPADRPAHDRALASLHVRLGADAVAAALRHGRAMPRSAFLASPPPTPTPTAHVAPVTGPVASLTPREGEVASLVARGLSNQQIADELVFTRHTADKHVTNILTKLGLASRAQLAVWWIARGKPSYF